MSVERRADWNLPATAPEVDGRWSSGIEPELAIQPIVARRRWLVSLRHPWEEGAGPLLRGAWGRPWIESTMTARCLRPPTGPTTFLGGLIDGTETGWHEGPAPQLECRCGIYAEKTDGADLTPLGRLAGKPTANGLVELSGKVIEGSMGYRAEHAAIVGPLELEVPCAGSGPSASCPLPVVAMVMRGMQSRGLCAEHLSTVDDDQVALSQWVERVVVQLGVLYRTPVFQVEERNTHGYR